MPPQELDAGDCDGKVSIKDGYAIHVLPAVVVALMVLIVLFSSTISLRQHSAV